MSLIIDEKFEELYLQNSIAYHNKQSSILQHQAHNVDRIKKFFNREQVYKQLKIAVSYLIPHRNDVKLILNIGGGSHTDGKSITVGLPECFMDRSYEEIFVTLRALVGHESQHINSSSFTEFVKFQEEVSEYLNKKFNIPISAGIKIAKHIANSVEDGRIEKILVNKFPGYLRILKFLNGTFWEHQPVDGKSELGDFMYTITTYSVMGIYPKRFEEFYKDSEMEKQFQNIQDDIIDGINALTCKIGLDICWDIVKKIEEYLSKLLENQKQEDEDFLQAIPLVAEFTTDEEKDKNSSRSKSAHMRPEKKKNDENNEDADKQSSNSGKDEKDESSGSDKDEKDENHEEADKENSNSTKSSQNAEQSENKSTDSRSNTHNQDDTNNEDDEDLVRSILDELTDDLIDEVKDKLEESKEAKQKPQQKKNDEKLNEKEVEEIKKKYDENEYQTNFKEIRGFPVIHDLEGSLKRDAEAFKRETQRIFRNKEALTLRNQKKGIIDPNNLYMVGMKQYNVFVQKGVPSLTDYVAYILKDGSGSMTEDNKELYSCQACTILEEGLKGVIPLKETVFDTYGDCVRHIVVKDFKEMSPTRNLAWNFYQELRRNKNGGGNKDGYSIRIATAELMKRPEKDKILGILSDGLPLNYNGGYEAGMKDVRDAVIEARKKGILVFAIMFGTQTFRDLNIENYQFMYEKNIISCDPDQITNNLIAMFKKIISR